MSESEAINLVENYIKSHRLSPLRINPKKLPDGLRSPDFEVQENGSAYFLCEVKTPSLILNERTRMFQWNTTMSKLREFMSKAFKQFQDYDPEHKFPWVLVFTSDYFQLNWTNCAHSIQGAVAFGGDLIRDFSNHRFIKDTQDEIVSIDLIIWCQVDSEKTKIHQLVPFSNLDSTMFEGVKVIQDKLTPYEDEEIMDRNVHAYTRKRET